MSKANAIESYISKNGGIVRLNEIISLGVSKQYFSEYAEKNNLERCAHGIYVSEDAWSDPFYIFQLSRPSLIFSHETALYLCGLSEREPFNITVTAKYGYNSPKLKADGVKVHQVKAELLDMGAVTLAIPFGHEVRCYNAERTVCDVASERDSDISAVNYMFKEYLKRNDKNIPMLMEYSEKMKCVKTVKKYLVILL